MVENKCVSCGALLASKARLVCDRADCKEHRSIEVRKNARIRKIKRRLGRPTARPAGTRAVQIRIGERLLSALTFEAKARGISRNALCLIFVEYWLYARPRPRTFSLPEGLFVLDAPPRDSLGILMQMPLFRSVEAEVSASRAKSRTQWLIYALTMGLHLHLDVDDITISPDA